MQIEFDPTKNEANQAKHGVALSVAEELEWETALVSPDDRQAYGEARQVALAIYQHRLYVVVFVDRADVRRIISLRKANLREVNHYVKVA